MQVIKLGLQYLLQLVHVLVYVVHFLSLFLKHFPKQLLDQKESIVELNQLLALHLAEGEQIAFPAILEKDLEILLDMVCGLVASSQLSFDPLGLFFHFLLVFLDNDGHFLVEEKVLVGRGGGEEIFLGDSFL